MGIESDPAIAVPVLDDPVIDPLVGLEAAAGCIGPILPSIGQTDR